MLRDVHNTYRVGNTSFDNHACRAVLRPIRVLRIGWEKACVVTFLNLICANQRCRGSFGVETGINLNLFINIEKNEKSDIYHNH